MGFPPSTNQRIAKRIGEVNGAVDQPRVCV
jgi:hypothetical protein